MHIRIAGLFAAAAAVVCACTPAPGSAEWCKGVLEGKIKATEQQVDANDAKCSEVIMKEMMRGSGG
jgi:hypothetical protein